jgi:putative PIN family toxin of toxin-antitoxin system
VVIDTNILIAALYRPGSSSGRVVAACRNGRLCAVVSPAIVAEYRHILPRAVRTTADVGPWLDGFLAQALTVHPASEPAVVSADPSDDMLFAAAIEAGAVAILTNDRPVLQIVDYNGVAVLRPSAMAECLDVFEGPERADPSCPEAPGEEP